MLILADITLCRYLARAHRSSGGRTTTDLTDVLASRIPSVITGLYQDPDAIEVGLIIREALVMQRPLAMTVELLFLEDQNTIFPNKVVEEVRKAVIEIVKTFPEGSRYGDDTLLVTSRVAEKFRNPSYTRIT